MRKFLGVMITIFIIFSCIYTNINAKTETIVYKENSKVASYQQTTEAEELVVELNYNQDEIETENNSEKVKIEESVNVDNKTNSKKENKVTALKDNQNKYTKVHKTSNGEKYTVIGMLEIPKINIKYDILSSTSKALLKISLNHYWGAKPNQVGNMCIVGHNYLDSRFFGKLHKLTTGDVVKITDSTGTTLEYYVYDKFVIGPYDTACTSQLTNGETEITLITCYNKGTQRTVVKARAK